MAMAAGWSVRPATAADADAIETINIDVARDVYRSHVPDPCLDVLTPNADACRLKIAHPRRCMFVGINPQGEVVGFVEGGVDNHGDGVLLNLWILPAGRGATGLAVALVRQAVICIADKGAADMRVEVASHLCAARALYGRKMQGAVAEDVSVSLDGSTECIMDGHVYYWPDIQQLRARMEQLAA